jgi:hypothetical protein
MFYVTKDDISYMVYIGGDFNADVYRGKRIDMSVNEFIQQNDLVYFTTNILHL